MIVALNTGKTTANVSLPAEIVGPLESVYGEAQWFATTGGVRLQLPGESAAIFRLTTH